MDNKPFIPPGSVEIGFMMDELDLVKEWYQAGYGPEYRKLTGVLNKYLNVPEKYSLCSTFETEHKESMELYARLPESKQYEALSNAISPRLLDNTTLNNLQ